jgi:ATP-dependent helicase/nuclease subunit A
MGGGVMTIEAGVKAQDRAANPQVSAWVDASAGTGKTTVLTSRVLRLLLAGTDPGRILCITFTKAAAAEMANRIIRDSGRWAVVDDAALVDALFKLTGERPDAAMQTRARQLFAEILEAPAGFRIQTIHAFCQSVLRRFPLEAGVPPHFDLIEDRTAAELLGEARQAVLVEAARAPDGPLGRAVAVLVEFMDDRGFAGLVQAILGARRNLSRAIADSGGVGLLIPTMWRALGLQPGDSAHDILAEACRDGAFDGTALREACATLSNGAPTDQARASAIAAWLASDRRAEGWNGYVAQFLTGKGEARVPASKAMKAVAHLIAPEAERLMAVEDRLRAAATARGTEAMLHVAAALFDFYERAKAVRGVLDYDDLIDRTRALVESNAASWVLYKLDGGIDHLLLDEAQDTNPDQWGIVKALAAEFFAGKGARDVNRTIFVVGDGKQSIYSFQGADPAALPAMRLHFEGQLAAARQSLEPVELTYSFRSTEPVLTLVDSVFDNPEAQDGVYPDPIARLRHGVSRTADPGRVEVWPVLKPADAPDVVAPWALPEKAPDAGDPETDLANRIARTIADWIETGERIGPGGRPIDAGDVMILVRRRTRFVGPMVRALKARRVPVAGVDRLALIEPLATRDLMALGRFLLLPEDDLTLAALLKSPLIGLGEEALFTLAHDRAGTLWNALLAAAERDAKSFEPARAFLSGLLAEVDFIRPFELFARVLVGPCPGGITPGGSGRRAMIRRLGPDALDPLDEFLSAALDYERSHPPTLEGFIGWLEASDAEIKRELSGSAGAVRIVTVHGAKGLQAPIVFLPDTTQIPSGNMGPQLLWHDAEGRAIPYWSPRAALRPGLCAQLAADLADAGMREYRRLLYVALTRAADRLYVCGWQGKRSPSPGNWHALVAEGMSKAGAQAIEQNGEVLHRLDYSGLPGRALQPVDVQRAAPPPPLPDWARRPALSEPRPFRPLAPSRLDMPGVADVPVRSPASPDDARRFRRGRAIHRLLQLLPDIAPGDRTRVAERMLAEFSAEERAVVAAEALAVLNNPACARFFGPSSRAEVPIVGRIGVRGIAGQIDRLLVEPDRVTIVDFKSGRIPAAGADAVPGAYLGQMAAYRAVLRQIYPDRAIDLVLIWTDGPVAVTLASAALDPFETYLTSIPAA